MNGSPTAPQIEWTRRFTNLDIRAGVAANGLAPDAQGRTPVGVGAQATAPLPQAPPTGPNGAGPGATGKGGAPNGADDGKLKARLEELARAAVGWDGRVKKVTQTFENAPLFEAFDKAKAAFIDTVKAGYARKDLSGAPKAVDAVEAAVEALEADAAKLPAKRKAAGDAADKVGRTSDADIAALPAEGKAALVRSMLGAGKPTGRTRQAQIRLYRDTPVDPGYRKDDEARQNKVAADLANDRELAAARGNWGSLDMEGLRKMLGKVVAAQSKEYGIPAPPIVFFPAEEPPPQTQTGKVVGGTYQTDGKLHINLDPASGIKDFTTAINNVLHENAHHYQEERVKMLEAGTLKPDDPRYGQALMFQVNWLEPGGYVFPDEAPNPAQAISDYKAQPVERSAYETGDSTTAKVASAVRPPKPPRPQQRQQPHRGAR